MQKSRWAPKEEEAASAQPAANATPQPEPAPGQAPYTAPVCPPTLDVAHAQLL
jgi:hypothetical protein